MLHYWATVVARAIVDSLAIIGHTVITVIFAVLVIAVTAFWSWQSEQVEHAGWLMFLKRHLGRELLKVVPVAIAAWIPFFIWFLFYTPYKIEDETNSKIVVAQSALASSQTNLTACQGNLSTELSRVELLSDRVSAQQQTIDSQQQMVNGQQSSINSCVTVLAREPNEPPSITIKSAAGAIKTIDSKGKPLWVKVFVLQTNKVIPHLKGIVGCNLPMNLEISSLAGEYAMSMPEERLSDREFRINFMWPAWSPSSPLVFAIAFSSGVGNESCAFKQL